MRAGQLREEAEKWQEKLVEDRRYLHRHPGTGFEIADTVCYVKEELEKMGYEPEECGQAGIVATAGGKKEGGVFLLRADMDALPVCEEADVDFASQNGKMHACGHDMHTAMLLGAARLLKEHEDEICGTVKLTFQPAEEIFEGAADMIGAGLLKDPEVDAAFMIHVMSGVPFAPGTVIVSQPGVSAPAADYFEIRIKGTGCHGSMPNTGVDPLNAAAHIVIALQEIQARELALQEQAVLTVGTMNAGTAPNVIPDTVTMGGSLRTFDEEVRAFVKKRICEISAGTAAAFRAEADVAFGSGCPTLVNDSGLCDCALTFARELLGQNRVHAAAEMNATGSGERSPKSAGSEDFAYISQKVPSVMIALAAGQPGEGYRYPQHHPMVKFDERALSTGCAVYAYMAVRWLETHNVQERNEEK